MKKIIIQILILLFLLAIILGGVSLFSFLKNNSNKDESYTEPSFTDYNQSLGNDIVNCEFKVISNFTYKNKDGVTLDDNRKVYYNTADESNPNLITFTGLSTENPILKGNAGEQSLIVLSKTDESITLAGPNGMGDVFIYTIFKKERVATWYKSYKLVNMPFAMLSMGYCY